MVPSRAPRPRFTTIAAIAALLREFYFALLFMEKTGTNDSYAEKVSKLLSGIAGTHERPLVRVRLMPQRIDGVFFCPALGQRRSKPGRVN
jgi:hypothetical protein